MSSSQHSACSSQLNLLRLRSEDSIPARCFSPSSSGDSGRDGHKTGSQSQGGSPGSHSAVDSFEAFQWGSRPKSDRNFNSNVPEQSVGEFVSSPPKLNRIAEVRKSQGISDRSMCKRLNIDLHRLRELEDPTRDITISELKEIQIALDVPLIDLLEDNNSLSRPIQERAKMVRVMKTAAAISDCKLGTRAQRLSEMLREQLIELMPELAEVSSWPQFGSRRGSDSVARVLAQEVNMNQISSQDH